MGPGGLYGSWRVIWVLGGYMGPWIYHGLVPGNTNPGYTPVLPHHPGYTPPPHRVRTWTSWTYGWPDLNAYAFLLKLTLVDIPFTVHVSGHRSWTQSGKPHRTGIY